MAKFEVGQKVRIRNGVTGIGDEMRPGDEFVIEEARTSNMPYRINGQWWMKESELEAIPIVFQPGDIVRAEKGDAIAQDALRTIGSIETLWLREWRFSDYEEKGYTLTLVKRPEPEIVLPTKPYAVIYFNSDVYIFDNALGYWISIDDSRTFAGHEILKTIANIDDYRVIFEGENE